MKFACNAMLLCALVVLSSGSVRADYDSYSSEYLQKGYMYLSPVPDSPYTSEQTRFVLVRLQNASPYDIQNLSTFIEVRGELSGQHLGTTKIASDDTTIIFETDYSFAGGELVHVSLNPTLSPGSGTVEPFTYDFAITTTVQDTFSFPTASLSLQQTTSEPESAVATKSDTLKISSDSFSTLDTSVETGPRILPNGVSVPSNFPFIDITINDNPDAGYIFIDNRTSGSNSFNVIFDNNGYPVWYLQTDDERRDMKVQKNGLMTMLARNGNMRFIGFDSTYTQVSEYAAVNGYETDEHECVVLEDGTYFLIGLRYNTVDMSLYVAGGNTNASVRETVIQEFTPEGDLIFQWRAWDNYNIADLVLDNPTSSSMRFPHMNAIDVDTDGNVILSCRHINEVTKINRSTGQMIWRLSGAHNQFTFIGDSLNGFTNQHAVRNVGPNRYLLFDNGDLHSPPVSRGIEYELDTDAMTATVVWEHRETPDVYSHYMANTQRLPNGNTLINWAIGSLPKLTEVRPDGTKAFEMNWADRKEAYRVWRSPWNGNAAVPYLMLDPQFDNITLIFNKFGDPDVHHYNIYADTSPSPTKLIATSTTTLAHISNLIRGNKYYFRVTAVDSSGNESGYSNEESATANFVSPGQNMVLNPKFSEGRYPWIFSLEGSGSGQWAIEDRVAHIDVVVPGSAISDVQFRQAGISLVQGRKYVFEFDAWSQVPRLFGAKVGQDGSPWTNYSGLNYTQLTPIKQHFKYSFTMQSPSDDNARVVFNSGIYPYDVYIDNVSLFMAAKSDFNLDGSVDMLDYDVLSSQWLATENLTADIDGSGIVDISELIIFMEEWSGNSSKLPAYVPDNAMGTVLHERWDNLNDGAISDLTANANYPDNPYIIGKLSTLEGPVEWGEYYGTRIRGYLYPPQTGDYTFWIASDDESNLLLSTDGTPDNAQLIAWVSEWTDPEEWDKFSEQMSSPIHLTAGNKYYIEILHAESYGGDNVAVAWSGPYINQQVIDGQYLSPWLTGLYGDVTGDEIVDDKDYEYFLKAQTSEDCMATSAFDLDGNCIIDLYEYAEFAQNWLN